MKKKIYIVDDHELFCKSLELLISNFEDYQVGGIFSNGKELIFNLQNADVSYPDLILLDVNMPIMNGFETISWMHQNYPELPVLILSMQDDAHLILEMLKKGARGYLLKDITPQILKKALDDTLNLGFYHTETVTKLLLQSLNFKFGDNLELRDKEVDFLKLVCTEKTYKEIASVMHLSPKTIDGYRESLFDKLGVRSRVGLVLYAIKNKLYSP